MSAALDYYRAQQAQVRTLLRELPDASLALENTEVLVIQVPDGSLAKHLQFRLYEAALISSVYPARLGPGFYVFARFNHH